MEAKLIKDQIKTILSGDSGLSTFGLKKVVEGVRESVPQGDYPFIALGVAQNEESPHSVNNTIFLTVSFLIHCLINELNVDTQLDTIFEFEKLVKVALSQDVTLSGKAVNSSFGETIYTEEFYPTRIVTIEFRAEYRQVYKTRV